MPARPPLLHCLVQVFIETVDSFQGKQLDVVILSCVRASTGGGLGEGAWAACHLPVPLRRDGRWRWALNHLLCSQARGCPCASLWRLMRHVCHLLPAGFVNDIRRMNVAITRAKRSLWVLGSRATLRSNPEWAALIRWAGIGGLPAGVAVACCACTPCAMLADAPNCACCPLSAVMLRSAAW